MAQQSSNKGNPAMKRMQNKALQAKRENCYRNGQARKKARRMEQEAREVRNLHLKEIGQPTPWEEAKAKRFAKRHP